MDAVQCQPSGKEKHTKTTSFKNICFKIPETKQLKPFNVNRRMSKTLTEISNSF